MPDSGKRTGLLDSGRSALRNRRKNILKGLRAAAKTVRARVVDPGSPARAIWIFGCQRSGTTYLENVFRHDFNSAVFGEFSDLAIRPDRTVLSDPETVRNRIRSVRARYAVIRPLFESDRADEWLDLLPESVGVWLFRDCPHVVDSMIRKWGDGFFEISRKNETDAEGNWRLEATIEGIRAETQQILSEDATAEMYARYWLARNEIPFRLRLMEHPRVLFLSMRELVSDPYGAVQRIFRKAGMGEPWAGFKATGDRSRLHRPVSPAITPATLSKSGLVYQQLDRLSGAQP